MRRHLSRTVELLYHEADLIERKRRRVRSNRGKLWGRQAKVNSPASGSGSLITIGWHTLVRVWDGQEVQQYVDCLRTNTTAVTVMGGWPLYRFGYQFTGSVAVNSCETPRCGLMRPPGAARVAPLGRPQASGSRGARRSRSGCRCP